MLKMKGSIILKVKKLGKNSNIFSRNAECFLSAVIAAVIMDTYIIISLACKSVRAERRMSSNCAI